MPALERSVAPPLGAPLPVYLAGPDVFLPDAAGIGAYKQDRCAAAGLDGRFPLDAVRADDLTGRSPTDQATLLFTGCLTMMDECVAGLINLSPFRGPSADAGTAFELGYLFAQGKPVVGYTSEARHYDHRVTDAERVIERFDLSDNLMLDRAAAAAGVEVVRRSPGPGEDPLPAVAAFEIAVEHLAAVLATRS
ncbi:MAG: nucleoside 2-deoxyribosyltransferase [Acidimicrobiia bacterium]|nr:nucleoside 2-deoxyribosyltransferase [Acidimicrobiia bacterium]